MKRFNFKHTHRKIMVFFGIWNRLEQKVRYWADKYDGVYVVTGEFLIRL
jgi:hypothetical protein